MHTNYSNRSTLYIHFSSICLFLVASTSAMSFFRASFSVFHCAIRFAQIFSTYRHYYAHEWSIQISLACYIYFRVKAYRELNLVRALDEDTGVFSFYFFTSPLGQTGLHPSSMIRNLCLLLNPGNHTILYIPFYIKGVLIPHCLCKGLGTHFEKITAVHYTYIHDTYIR